VTPRGSRGKPYVGTSGWSYDHWRGPFYAPDVAKKDWFAFFAKTFSTVELNATFYRLFPEKTFDSWAAKAPEDFIYAVKMWRMVTHRKRLVNVEQDVASFLVRARRLDEHLGPILIQLPPGVHRDDALLGDFLALIGETCRDIGAEGMRFTLEFRHATWFDDKVYSRLEEAGVALCLPDREGLEVPRVETADFIYVRFHGRPRVHSGCYTRQQLRPWATWINGQLDNGRDVYVYFNNDLHAYAVKNAREIAALLGLDDGLQSVGA